MAYREIVQQLKKKYKTNDPFDLCEALNIPVFREPLGKLRGYYHYYKRNKMIHINMNLSEEMQRIVCAHELGHALCHPKQNTCFLRENTLFSSDRFEKEANQFAAELLLPDDLLEKYPSYTIEQIAATEHTTVELIQLKFNFSIF
ncbi:MAG: ImmA/IrrE family metallo-endopeptidase [Clostridiaceae bacterium]|nr:ImmA/IrrE family metallo-endopeptidase [Clostridiaceae bacterium]